MLATPIGIVWPPGKGWIVLFFVVNGKKADIWGAARQTNRVVSIN